MNQYPSPSCFPLHPGESLQQQHSSGIMNDPQPLSPTRDELAAMRTLLAAKRTFLAWCRTAMALMGFGFILEKTIWYVQKEAGIQLTRAIHETGMLSLFAFCAGGMIILLEGIRMIRTTRQLATRQSKNLYGTECILVLALAAIMIACFVYSMKALVIPTTP
jgi:putative membrane protein